MNQNKYKIIFDTDWPIINILVFACYQLKIENFENKIGADKIIAESFLDRLHLEKKSELPETYISGMEFQIIKNAVTEVGKEVEEWECPIIIGVTWEEVQDIVNEVHKKVVSSP